MLFVQSNSFLDMIENCDIPDERSKSCRHKDCQTLFIACNYEDDKNSTESKVNWARCVEHSLNANKHALPDWF